MGAPNLTDDTWLYGGRMDALRKSIAEGRNGNMPAHEPLLGADRGHVVSAYVYSLSHREMNGGNDN
jgi:cytochrome c oxidase cbb3-type subunit 3